MKTATLRRLAVLFVGVLLLSSMAACGADSNAAGINSNANNAVIADAGNNGGGSDASQHGGDASGDAGVQYHDASGLDASADASVDVSDTDNTPRPLDDSIGAPCSADSDCQSGHCASVGGELRGVCTVDCQQDDGCPAGWSCETDYAGDGKFCTCESTAEICDGVDNDCDGLVDEGDANTRLCGDEALCLGNTCGCPSGFSCDGACRDLYHDADHCGACGNACEVACDEAQCVGAAQVSVGADHLCVVLSDGQVRCAGNNAHGQLGDGTTASSDRPVDALWMNQTDQVVAADQFSCALAKTGEVYCWGANPQGQVAEAPLTERHRPTRWQQISAAVDVDVRNYTGCAATATGEVRCWGPHGFAVPSLVEGLVGATKVAVGDYHRCALVADGRVACWGNNAQGQLGDGTTLNRESVVLVPQLSRATDIAAGEEHTCVLKADGTVMCFGSNSDGQLGVGEMRALLEPANVTGLEAATELTAGARHSCAVAGEDHEVYCWGDNAKGQLGDGTTTSAQSPVEVHGLPPAVSVDAGDQTTCALTTDGQVYCWGERFGVNPRRVEF